MTGRRIVIIGPADGRALAAQHVPDRWTEVDEVEPLRSPPVENLVNGLLAAGVAVDLVTCSPSVRAPVVLESDRLSLFIAPYRPHGRGVDGFRVERRGLAALLARTTGSLVHAHWTYEFALASLGDRRPRLVTIHDAPLTILRHMPHPYRLVRAGMAYRVRAARFTGIAVSPYIAGRWRVEMRDDRPLHVIPNAVVVEPSDRAAVDPRTRRLVCVSDASPWKNVDGLLHAFQLVRRQWPDARLSLVGSGLGPDDPLAVDARRRDGATGVDWHGQLSHSRCLSLLASAEVFVHPSLEESFGMALAEAMSIGVPVVAGAESGAVPWILQGGSAGVLVDVRSPDSFARGIASVLRDPELANGLARRARHRVASFSTGAVAERHLAVYELATRRHQRSTSDAVAVERNRP